jgi:hypothetical protein
MRYFENLDFCYSYICDVLIASTSEDGHEQHLRTLFQRFSEYGVLLNPAKCVFGAKEETFLGYTVSAEGTRPLKENYPFQTACLSQRSQTFTWHAQFLPMVHTSRQHTSATSHCVSWSQGQRITNGGLETHHEPGFLRVARPASPSHTSSSPGPICNVGVIYRCLRYFNWHRLATACMRRLTTPGFVLA